VAVVADIMDRALLAETFASFRPDIVYHAAAYKHVPLMEAQPLEAITNNVFGTQRVIAAALAEGVQKLVLISTDKAVNAVGIMGMTKRLAEGVVEAHNGSDAVLVAVRFGNVLGSDGSVFPLFRRQIAEGGPVTLTDPEVTRYFMLLSEAAQLVLQAGAIGKGGEIFFLDMGQPIRIADMARNMISLSGLQPDRDIEIRVTGLRPGERLNESLFNEGEELLSTQHEKVFMVHRPPLDGAEFLEDLEELRRLTQAREHAAAVKQLKVMVARY
jgi:FlaA1/EpsC-like NDP-sugar epimerase